MLKNKRFLVNSEPTKVYAKFTLSKMRNQTKIDKPVKTALLILGAGNSSRLGRPKQLLGIKNTTLLEHTLDEAFKVSCQVRVLVLGAYQDEIKSTLTHADISVLHNKNWESGMASSIQVGMTWLIEHYDPEQVLILLCDQPFINHQLLRQLISYKASSSKGIIASSYGAAIGVPVIFDKNYFPDLLALKGKEGAKKLVGRYGDDVGTVSFPQGNIDIDTEADYRAFLKKDWAYFDEK